jgi:hypothetical protein
LPQTSKSAISFLLLLVFSSTKWRRGQNRFCLEARGREEREGVRGRGRDGPNNVCIYE